MTTAIEALDSLVTDSVVTLFQAGLTLLGTIGILLVLDLRLALITFCIFPFVGGGSIWFRLVPAGAFRAHAEINIGAITGDLLKTLSGIRRRLTDLRPGAGSRTALRGAEQREPRRQHGDRQAQRRPTSRPLKCSRVSPSQRIVLYGGLQAIEGQITAGTGLGCRPSLPSASCWNRSTSSPKGKTPGINSGMAALEKIFQLLDEKPNLEALGPTRLKLSRGSRGHLRGHLVGAPARGGSAGAPPGADATSATASEFALYGGPASGVAASGVAASGVAASGVPAERCCSERGRSERCCG